MDNQLLEAIIQEQRDARAREDEHGKVLQAIDTKLTILVGSDGNNGEVSEIKSRITNLEHFRWLVSGAAALAGTLFTLFKYFFPRH